MPVVAAFAATQRLTTNRLSGADARRRPTGRRVRWHRDPEADALKGGGQAAENPMAVVPSRPFEVLP
jgi:hypothetical protein